MPRVPVVTGPTVSDQPAPNAYESSIASPELLGASARQGQALGDAATTAGVQIQAVRNEALAQANALRVDDAVNRAQEVANRLTEDPNGGFKTQTGYAAVSRDSGMPLADEYTGRLRDQVNQIAGTLSNPQQRAMFTMKVNNVVTAFNKNALEHERQQYQDYGLSVKDAMVKNAQSALALNPTDEQNVALQTTRIRAAFEGGVDDKGTFIPGSAQMQGKSAAWAKETADQAVSDAHGNAVKLLLEQGNVNGAMLYFNRYASQMVAKDVLEVQGKLQSNYDTHLGATVADQVFTGARPAIMPNDYTRLTALVMGAESGGQRFAPGGGLLTSPKGAKGEMQVVDSTNTDPGFGVKPAQNDSPDERARVGRDYLAAMIVRYKGDVPKALAAYNAGPGAVDKALADADQDVQTGAFRGGGTPGADYWLTKLPPETQAYVQGISAKFAGGAGTPARPTLQDLHDQARTMLGPNATILAVNTATEQLTQRFDDAQKAIAQRGDEVVARAMQALDQNGGRFSQLPASVRSDLTQYAPGKVDDVMKYGTRVAKGDDTTNPAVYTKLSDPNTLRTLSEAQLYQLRGQLSVDDFKHFVEERSKLLNPSISTGPGDLNSSAVKNALDSRLRELKIDPTPKDDGGNDAARVGTIRRIVDTQLLAAQQSAGRKFNDAETTAAIDRLFATNVEIKGALTTYRGPVLGVNPGGIFGGDLTSDTRNAIKAAFKKRGVDNPTDAQIFEAFAQQQLTRRSK